jgi:hypothetical protein
MILKFQGGRDYRLEPDMYHTMTEVMTNRSMLMPSAVLFLQAIFGRHFKGVPLNQSSANKVDLETNNKSPILYSHDFRICLNNHSPHEYIFD